MKVHMSEPLREMPSFDKDTLEKACIEAIVESVEFFDTTPLKVCEEGVYLNYAGRRFLFSVEVVFQKEVPLS